MGIIHSRYIYEPRKGQLAYWCPGCQFLHILLVRTNSNKRPSWEFNGDYNHPTFSPSVLVKIGHYCPDQPQPPNCETCNEQHARKEKSLCALCHSYVRNGLIEFLSDCTHILNGQTVPMVQLPKYILDHHSF